MTLNIKATYSDTDVVIVAFLRMSTSNFQWRHDGLGWRINSCEIPLLRACFIAEQVADMIPSFFRRIRGGG